MSTKKEMKWLMTEECMSIPMSKTNQKSWRSSRVSLDDSKPAVKPPRKILRLGQNDADLNQRSTSENSKRKFENIIWNAGNKSQPNSCYPAPYSIKLREHVQKEEVLGNRKLEPDDKELVPKNVGLQLNTTCTEASKKVGGKRINLKRDVRKVISQSNEIKFDNIKNNSFSLERWSSFSNDNQKQLYFPLVNPPYLDQNELKSGNSQSSLAAKQVMDEIYNTGNEHNTENISLQKTLKKTENKSINKSKDMIDPFLSKDNAFRKIEFKCGSRCKESREFNLSTSLDSGNIKTHSELPKSSSNGVYKDNAPRKHQNLSANFGVLTDEDVEDFVEDLKLFLQRKIVSPQYIQPELSDHLDDSNVHGFDCQCLECSKVEESKKILEGLHSRFKKSAGKKMPLVKPLSFNEIDIITTVRVVNSVCDDDNGQEQNFEKKHEDNDLPSKDNVCSFNKTTLLKSNLGKSNFNQTNPIEYEDPKDLARGSLVSNKKIIKSSGLSENRPTNSVLFKGNFSEFVFPLKSKINFSLSKNILPKFNSKMLLGYFKGTCLRNLSSNPLVPLKGFNIQKNELNPMANVITCIISKYCTNFFLSTRNWISFQPKRKLLHQRLEILTEGQSQNRKCKKQMTKNDMDAVDHLKSVIEKTENFPNKKDLSTLSSDLWTNENLTEKTWKLSNITQVPVTNCHKNFVSFQDTDLYFLPEFTSECQTPKKEFNSFGKDKYIKSGIFDMTKNCEIEDYLDETSLYWKTCLKEKTYKTLPSKFISNDPKTTVPKYLTLDYDPEVYDYFPDSILSTSPAAILVHEERSFIPRNEHMSREPLGFDSSDFKNFDPSLKGKHLIGSSKEGQQSTCSTPQAQVEMQGLDDELNSLASTESLQQIINDGFLSETVDDDDDIFPDWKFLLQDTSASERFPATNEARNDYFSNPNNTDGTLSSERHLEDDLDDNFQAISAEEETISNLKQTFSDFSEKTPSKVLNHSLEMTNSDSSLDSQNEDDNNNDDDSDSVLSLYAPSDASFLDENDANISNDSSDRRQFLDQMLFSTDHHPRSVENLSLEEEREAIKPENIYTGTLPKTKYRMNSHLGNATLGIQVGNIKSQTLDDTKDVVSDRQLSDTQEQELKTQDPDQSSSMKTQAEDLPVPIGFCSPFVKMGYCSKLAACQFKHEYPSKEEFLRFSFFEECKNANLSKAFDLFVVLKDLNRDSPEMTDLLLRRCLCQSNCEMSFLLIPDLIHHKMLTPKIVHDIFTICSPCPLKYEEKLWKLYETMMLLNLSASINSILILLQMYFKMSNWHKIWLLLLNAIHIEPLSVIPTAICHGALTFVLNDSSCQYLSQAVDWISICAVDDLWNIEPCLLYHLSLFFKTKGCSNAYWVLRRHLQQINNFPEEIIFIDEVDEPQTNPQYFSCLQNIQEIQANKNWLQLSDIFIYIYESLQLNSTWFIQPIVEAFLKIDNFSLMTTMFSDFVNTTCGQLNNLVKENSSYPISGCRKHLVRMIADLINFCYSHHMWTEGNQIVSVLLKNKLEFDLKDHLDSIPYDTALLALDICLHSVEPLKALSLLEGLGWFCQLPPLQFLNSLHLKQWLKKILKVLIEQLSNSNKLPNGCRVFSLFVSISQEETSRWHTNDELSPFNSKQFPCINHIDFMTVSNEFILQCLTSENVDSAIYAYNMIKSLLFEINPGLCNVATFRALLVASHLGPRIPPCARELYNFCVQHLEAYPTRATSQPPWTLEIVPHLTDIEMHLVIEDFLDCLYNILCNQSILGQNMTDALQLCVMVRNDIVTNVFPNICYLRNVPVNKTEVLQQALFVLKTYVLPPIEAKMNNCQTGLIVNPESLKHFLFCKETQRKNQRLQFQPVPNKKLKSRFKGKGRFR